MRAPFTLRQLEYFEAVAAEGTLTAAARQCHVTPSALTLAIDELERSLAVQLLVRRKGRGVALTEAGSRLLARTRLVLSDVEDLAADALRSTTTIGGRLVVGCFTTLTPFLVPAIVTTFEREHPEVTLETVTADSADLHALLAQGRIDVALLYSVDVPASLAFEPVVQYRPHVLVAATHPLAGRDTVSLADLAEEPLVVLDVPPTRQNTRAIFDRLGLTPRLGKVSTSFEAVRCMVGAGLGYAVMFQRPATPVTYDGHEVRALTITDDIPPTVVGLARPAGAPRTATYAELHRVVSGLRMGGEPVSTPSPTSRG
jgi:DNA-binding transcriptional LysR family regulator